MIDLSLADASRKTHFMIELIKRWVRGFKGIDWALVCPVPTPRPSPLFLSFFHSFMRAWRGAGVTRVLSFRHCHFLSAAAAAWPSLPSGLLPARPPPPRRRTKTNSVCALRACSSPDPLALFETLSSHRTAKRRSDPGAGDRRGGSVCFN